MLSGRILEEFGYDTRTCELARIAGYMHDIGNMINRSEHAQSGALISFGILQRLGFPRRKRSRSPPPSGITTKDRGGGQPDCRGTDSRRKSDVRRTRVRCEDTLIDDIHDRVNYAVKKAALDIDAKKKVLVLKLEIDTSICPVMEYFQIFLDRMMLSKQAANYLGMQFELIINDTRLL
jgi:HD-GYP domain-containing protein (c-di-GMP phosphodiesterase class II)